MKNKIFKKGLIILSLVGVLINPLTVKANDNSVDLEVLKDLSIESSLAKAKNRELFEKPIYKKQNDSEYYVPNGLSNIFDLTLKNVVNPIGWAYNFKNFTVIKDDKYIPAPNVQMFGKNLITRDLAQGWDYTPEDKEPLTTGRFDFPLPDYKGEYPLTYMSLNGVLPSSWWDGVWKGIKALVGVSFIDVPNEENFNSLVTLNNNYKERELELAEKLQLPLKVFHDAIYGTWATTQFQYQYMKPEEKEQAEARQNRLTFGSLSGKEAYNAAKTKRADVDGGKYRYKSLEEALYGNEEHKPLQGALSAFEEWKSKLTEEDKAIVNSTPLNELLSKFKNMSPRWWLANYPEDEIWKEGEDPNIIGEYENAQAIINKYNAFTTKVSKTGPHSYAQCLIQSDEKNKCISSKYGEPTTIAIGNAHVLSGGHEVLLGKKSLTREDVITYLEKLRSFTGPYYTEVLGNLLKSIEYHWGRPLDLEQKIYRVLPYDRNKLPANELDQFSISDPRNDIFRATGLGGIVSEGIITNFNFFNIKPQKIIINIIAAINDWAIYLNNIISFDVLDDLGLSPAKLWGGGLVSVLIPALAIIFLVSTIKFAFNYLSKGASLRKFVSVFLIFVLQLGFFTLLAVRPEQTWGSIKGSLNTWLNFGELTTIKADPTLGYLIPNGSSTYALPYYDAWSVYNVGHGLKAPENYIINEIDSPLPEEINFIPPKMNGLNINHWSMVLANSFDYYGKSEQINSIKIEKDGEEIRVNGPNVNNNAYRVVDHFLAPRVTITDEGNGKTVTTKENPFNNGKFQKAFFELLPRLFISLINLFVLIVKVLTFFWLWYKLYTIVVQIFTEKLKNRNKSWLSIFGEILVPIVYIIIIGVISGIGNHIAMTIENPLISMLILFVWLKVLMQMLIWWSHKRGFPKTLIPVVLIIGGKAYQEDYRKKQLILEQKRKDALLGIKEKEEDSDDLKELRKHWQGIVSPDVDHRIEEYNKFFDNHVLMKEYRPIRTELEYLDLRQYYEFLDKVTDKINLERNAHYDIKVELSNYEKKKEA